MSNSTIDDSSGRPRWAGWVRRGLDAWERVCLSESIGECARLLGEYAEAHGIKAIDRRMTTGRVPSDRPAEAPQGKDTTTVE